MTRTLITTLVVLLTLSAAACGDDGPISTGIDRNKKLSEVTDADARMACMNIASVDIEGELTRDQECMVGAVYVTETEAACEAAHTACLGLEPTPTEPTEPTTDCSMANAGDAGGCEATVGQLEDCYNATYTAQRNLIESLSCADAGAPYPEFNPPECQTLEALCPGLLD